MQTVDKSPIPMCVSAISTPLPVRALYTTTYTNGNSASFYEQVINDQSTVSNMTTMTQGTAVADPLYVAWEAKDLSLFPVAYATSLAQKIWRYKRWTITNWRFDLRRLLLFRPVQRRENRHRRRCGRRCRTPPRACGNGHYASTITKAQTSNGQLPE
jgi:hypothetical protein